MVEDWRRSPRCPYCGAQKWSLALGSGPLKIAGIILAEYDEQGRTSMDPGSSEHGIEVAAYVCQGCGHIRFHDPRFEPEV